MIHGNKLAQELGKVETIKSLHGLRKVLEYICTGNMFLVYNK